MIIYPPAKEKGLGCSLFERYAISSEENPEVKNKNSLNSLLMLKIQYRMVSK